MSLSKDVKWEGPPANERESMSTDPSNQGILGSTLRQALDELVQMDEDTEDDALRLDETSSAAIRAALGRAMENDTVMREQGPKMLVRARVETYQKLGGKWRVELQNAQWRRRYPLAQNRRKSEKPSLWQISQEQTPAEQDATLWKDDSLLLLAFNDD